MRSITPQFKEKLESTEQTPANNADPKMRIKVSRARSTVMDSHYWTVETIREKPGLGEISLAPKRERAYGDPTRIYEIHIDEGIIKTAIREYPDSLKGGWKPQFIIGSGLSVAIAFDGYWQYYRKNWRLVTDPEPLISWVDDANTLWCQLWDDDSSRVELAQNAIRVRMIRAWKNVNMPDKDQGLVVAYIKTDGKVYYRNWCQRHDYFFEWEDEREVAEFEGAAVSFNLFITNDYRMGFVIEDDSGQIHWLITGRNWAGMALGTDQILVDASLEVGLLAVTYHKGEETERIDLSAKAETAYRFGSTINSIAAMNVPDETDDWGRLIDIHSQHPIEVISLGNIVATDLDSGTGIQLSQVEALSKEHFRLYISDTIESGINNVSGDIRVTVTGAVNEAGYQFTNMESTFTPQNLTPEGVPLPEVLEVWNE